MEKIVFLDVDGTLCNDLGVVPASAKAAILKAKANGHRFYLCTGRSKAEITEEVLALELDGIIGAGGGYCETQGEVILHEVFDEAEVRKLVKFLEARQIEYYLESNQGLFASGHLVARLNQIALGDADPDSEVGQEKLASMQWFIDLLETDQSKIDYTDINKVSFINHTVPYDEVHEEYAGKFQMLRSTVPIFGKDSGEIAQPNISKKTAIELLLKHLDAEEAETLAFGDGHNDLEMFEAVTTGIAMGNACEALLQAADDVTATHDEGGIALSLE